MDEGKVINLLNQKVGKQLDPFEHARKRPRNYIGTIKTEQETKKVVITTATGDSFEDRSISYNQGLERIFIEILSNAKDNYWESEKGKVEMTFIKVHFVEGKITVENDGLPIPVIKHPYEITTHEGKKITQEAYPAEKFFGNMNFGTNFDKDKEKKKSSGLNGMGGKLANIFSDSFEVTILDAYNKQQFYQKYTEAGKKKGKPVVKSYSKASSKTRISFLPDYKYFAYEALDNFEMLIKRHCYDTAFVFPGLRVYFNNQLIKFTSFGKIVDFYSTEKIRLAFKLSSGDECIVIPNMKVLENDDFDTKNPKAVSFINGIRCDEGGVHVMAWATFILNKFKNLYNAKAKKTIADKKRLYPFFSFYIKAETVEEISFEHGNVKNKCVSPDPYPLVPKKDKKTFADTLDTQVAKMLKWPIMALIEAKLSGRKGTVKKIDHIFGSNFQHANKAGPNYKGMIPRCGCISEGVSAHKLFENLRAMAKNGPDYYGGIWIRGKFSNVEKKTGGAVLNGDDVSFDSDETHESLKAFYNLRTGVDYSLPENRKTLFYDVAYAMTDADDDGIHIRGLLMIFFSQFKGLLESGFFGSFNTYNVILVPKKKKEDTLYFFNHLEFQKWLGEKGDSTLGKYNAQYFKGLGSYSPTDYELHAKPEGQKINIFVKDPKAIDSLKVAFSADSGARKDWMKKTITTSLADLELCPPSGKLSISDFVNKDLVHFFVMTLSRALPSRLDGLKQSQRQILDTVLSHPKMHSESIGLVPFEGLVKSHTGYEHASVYEQTCNMVVGYPGANNFPLLLNKGGYANRVTNKSASARYLKTMATPEIKFIYRDEDTPLLERGISSGRRIEYKFLLPVAPLHLMNGSRGIAGGWASEIYPYNPIDIINGLRECIDETFDVDAPDFVPWFRGFTGKIRKEGNSIFSDGIVEETDEGFHIKEIPIGVTMSYIHETYINKMASSEPEKTTKKAKKIGKKTKIVEEVAEKKPIKVKKIMDTTKNVNFPETILIPNPKGDLSLDDFGFLSRRLKAPNFTVVDESGIPATFKSAREVLYDFYKCRVKYYPLRKKYWAAQYRKDAEILEYKIRFIQDVNDGTIKMSLLEKDIVDLMDDMEYLQVDGSYDYLLKLSIRSLTLDKKADLEKELEKTRKKIEDYEKTSPKQLYKNDLDDLEMAWNSFLKKTQLERKEVRIV